MAQSEQDFDAIQQTLLYRAKEAAAQGKNSVFSLDYGLLSKTKEERKKEVMRLWSHFISSKNITHFKHYWQEPGQERESVEFRFQYACQRLTELREIAKKEEFVHELKPDGAHYNIEFAHRTLSSDKMIVASTLEIPLESPPAPLSTVPFRRDLDFVDCGLLDEIQKDFLVRTSRLAIVGLGGVGKSKLATELSFRIREKSPEIWFFWINASNAGRLKQSFVEMAPRLKIQRRHDPEANIFELVIKWLCNEENGKWILVLDNVVHESLPMNDEGYQQLWQSLASCTNGSIIITSRSYGTALHYVHQNDVFPIEPMNEPDAVELMKKRLDGLDYEENDLKELVRAVDYMPLAITQAAAYIVDRNAPVREYINKFQKSDDNKIKLFSHEKRFLDRDWEESYAVLKNLQWSFDHLRRNKPSAANLLSIMSFFHQASIPDQLLRQTYTTYNGQNSTSQDPFEEDIRLLQQYSLISMISPANTYQMLKLVQIATRKWLDIHDQTEKWRGSFINLLSTQVLAQDEHMRAMEFLFPLIQSAASKEPASEALSEWSLILHKGAEYAQKMGELEEMMRMARKASRARERLFRRDDERTMASIKLLAVAQEDTASSQLHK